jgi:hypothetical protein
VRNGLSTVPDPTCLDILVTYYEQVLLATRFFRARENNEPGDEIKV